MPSGRADIYIWEDASGIRHVSNQDPPPGAEVLIRTREAMPRTSRENASATADARLDDDSERRGPEERLKARTADLERRVAEAEEKVKDAAEALERAEDRLASAEARFDRERRYAGTVLYGTGFRGLRYDRFKHRKFDTGRRDFKDRKTDADRRKGADLDGRPFPLGTIHLPLFNARDHFRRPENGGSGTSRFDRRNDDAPRRDGQRNDGRRR